MESVRRYDMAMLCSWFTIFRYLYDVRHCIFFFFSFCIIVTALNEYSCLRYVTNKLYRQSLVSVQNTPLYSRQYNTSGSFPRRRKFRLSNSTYKTNLTCTAVYTQHMHKISFWSIYTVHHNGSNCGLT